ncbi:LytR/AlgR family response regulator transcription factor [Chryseolinea lacunae]|uniref:LytTR family transcriptional regulator DNA-binding domain-containing protein n=1 Tax=Chryseolinea lacunae TaxID=2801331 RepID=A0ABS1KVF4_9BACT|nr:LytTR family DNA-binding domain-containing protein [Chryseolinea lacunae]MBL0743173.1 LytTR family transcriptional regulator DNA-binding domain-containing protein [Chryseolinea lacunae]
MLTALRILVIHSWPEIHWDIENIFRRYPELTFVGTCNTLAESKVVIHATQPDVIVLALDTEEDNRAFAYVLESPRLQFVFLSEIENEGEGEEEPSQNEEQPPQTKDDFLNALAFTMEDNFLDDNLEEARVFKKNVIMNQNRIALRTAGFVQLIAFDEVLYLASDSGYTTFHLTDGKKLVSSKPLKDFDDTLPLSHFVRTHQSYVVNHHYIDKIFKENYILLKNGMEIPVAVRKKTEITRLLAK